MNGLLAHAEAQCDRFPGEARLPGFPDEGSFSAADFLLQFRDCLQRTVFFVGCVHVPVETFGGGHPAQAGSSHSLRGTSGTISPSMSAVSYRLIDAVALRA